MTSKSPENKPALIAAHPNFAAHFGMEISVLHAQQPLATVAQISSYLPSKMHLQPTGIMPFEMFFTCYYVGFQIASFWFKNIANGMEPYLPASAH